MMVDAAYDELYRAMKPGRRSRGRPGRRAVDREQHRHGLP
jgi:hypothetical protein